MPDPFGNLHGFLSISAHQQCSKLLTPEAGHHIAGPHLSFDQGGNIAQHQIPYMVAVVIIELLEEIDIQEQAAQCGYCLNGMVMTAVSLLADNPHPDDKAIRDSLHMSLCRCGSHARIVRAIKRAAKLV